MICILVSEGKRSARATSNIRAVSDVIAAFTSRRSITGEAAMLGAVREGKQREGCRARKGGVGGRVAGGRRTRALERHHIERITLAMRVASALRPSTMEVSDGKVTTYTLVSEREKDMLPNQRAKHTGSWCTDARADTQTHTSWIAKQCKGGRNRFDEDFHQPESDEEASAGVLGAAQDA